MSSASLVKESRLRAGLTQSQLALRCGTTQSAIARIERGAVDPSWERVVAMARACGFDISPTISPIDDAELASLRRNLDLTPDERVKRVVAMARFIRAGRVALADSDA